jgi:aspartyl aminopeptidase
MWAMEMDEFITASPSPYHAVATATDLLDEAGFEKVDRAGPAPPEPGPHYVVDGGALVAWNDAEINAHPASFTLIGAHTDSPNLRIKPRPDTGRVGYRQLGIEVYGGALLNSWLDRDLGLSGRVVVRDGAGTATHPIRIDRPILRVAQLAIHLDRDVNDGLKLDRQQHLTPIWGMGDATEGEFNDFVAAEIGVAPSSILAWDIMTHDLTPPRRLGRDSELLAAPRIDNEASCWAAITALLAARPAEAIPAAVLFDHEEVGSTSATGAIGQMLPTTLERISTARGDDREGHLRSLHGSWLASADCAHAVHPNYLDRFEPDHHVHLNGGPVVKMNANERYATDAHGQARFALACGVAEVPMQIYVNQSAMPCGSTIGPLSAANLGVRTVDVGIAQLSMHSARELCGADDPAMLASALTAFLELSPG